MSAFFMGADYTETPGWASYNAATPAAVLIMSSNLQYSELSSVLSRLGYSENPAGFHGALCGALCVKEAPQVDLGELLEAGGSGEEDRGNGATDELLRLRGESREALGSAEMAFQPLLPAEDAELSVRVQALAAWCEGFLFGLTTGRPLNMKQCSAEFKEILRDFTQFTHAGLAAEDNPEIEENAYSELVEYIRVGVQLIFMELRGAGAPAPDADDAPTLH